MQADHPAEQQSVPQPEAEKKEERPAFGKILRFDHIHFWVGNAKQAASYYTGKFGFEYYAYKGLETGERSVVTHVIRNHEGAFFAFSSVYTETANEEMNRHLVKHGDGVKDIAFEVENVHALFEHAVKGGARVLMNPTEFKDEHGSVILATIKTYGDTIHTFVERKNYKGIFLPGFKPHHSKEALNKFLPTVKFEKVDHCSSNQPDKLMEEAVQYYENTMNFRRYWSIDDTIVHTQYSGLRSIVTTDYDENVKLPINEPANGKKRSQIQEYVDYYHGAGVQHIALYSNDIVNTVENMRNRGVEFLSVPDTYYDHIKKSLPRLDYKITEDIELLQKNKILIDYDDKGYLLQILTEPVEDRPTLFFEVIQRHNHVGFGAGNFVSLFTGFEQEQQKRGNLTDM